MSHSAVDGLTDRQVLVAPAGQRGTGKMTVPDHLTLMSQGCAELPLGYPADSQRESHLPVLGDFCVFSCHLTVMALSRRSFHRG